MTVGSGRKALTDPTLTMLPRPADSMVGSRALVTRTAAIRFRVSEVTHWSSVTDRKPPSRGVTAPTLLTRTSTPPRARAAARSGSAAPGTARSTATKSTRPSPVRAANSSEGRRAPAMTCAPSSARIRVIARPMPRLAPVTTAIRPSRSRFMRSFAVSPSAAGPRSRDGPAGIGPQCPSSDPAAAQPVQHGVGDVPPAVVDGERVTAALELLEVGHRGGVPVLLEGRPGDDIGHGVVGGAGDEQQRAAGLVAGVDRGLRVHDEVGRRGLEQWPGRRGDRPRAEQLGRLLLGQRVPEPEPELLLGQLDRPVQVRRIAQRGQAGAQL